MLEEAKLSDESYDAALRRLLEDGGASLWTESDIRAIARSEAEAVIEDVTQHGL